MLLIRSNGYRSVSCENALTLQQSRGLRDCLIEWEGQQLKLLLINDRVHAELILFRVIRDQISEIRLLTNDRGVQCKPVDLRISQLQSVWVVNLENVKKCQCLTFVLLKVRRGSVRLTEVKIKVSSSILAVRESDNYTYIAWRCI